MLVAQERRAIRLQSRRRDLLGSLVDGALGIRRYHTSTVGERERVVDSETIRAIPLTGIRGVRVRSSFRVDGAVLANGVSLGVPVDDVRVEELTRLHWQAVGEWVSKVGHGLSGAVLCAEGDVEGAGSEEFGTHVGVVAF